MSEKDNLSDLIWQAHNELMLASKHLHQALHENVTSSFQQMTPQLIRYYSAMALKEVDAALSYLNETSEFIID